MSSKLAVRFVILFAAVFSMNGCEPPVTCGTGTRLDDVRNECVAELNGIPELNRVINSFALGDFNLENINVPDELVTGSDVEYSFDVRNSTTVDEDLVGLRVVLFAQTPESVQAYFDHIKLDGPGCTNTCGTSGNGTCEDGFDTTDQTCRVGSDCADCGPRNSGQTNWSCVGPEIDPGAPRDSACGSRGCGYSAEFPPNTDNGYCQCDDACVANRNCCEDYQQVCAPGAWQCLANEFCDADSRQCHYEVITIASLTLDSLKAGETKSFSYTARLPPNWTTSETYSIAFILGETWMKYGSEGTAIPDPEQPALQPGESTLQHAAGLYVDAVQVPVVVDATNTLDVSLSADTTSLVLDDTPDNSKPLLTANVKVTTPGVPLKGTASVSFDLELPGHTLDLSSYTPETPVATYDANRKFGLQLLRGSGLVDNEATLVGFCAWCTLEDSEVEALFTRWRDDANSIIGSSPDSIHPEECRRQCRADGDTLANGASKYVIEQGPELDLSFPLVLSQNDVKVLSETLNNVAANTTLNTTTNEIAGHLVVNITSGPTSGTTRIPVVFRAPSAPKEASEFDAYEPQEVPPAADEYAGPDGYQEKDHLTPTFYRGFGSEWLGAEMQVKNVSSKDRRKQAVVKQAWQADNFFRINVLQGQYNLLKIAGEIDFGTRREARHNKANGIFIVPSVPSAATALSFLQSGELTNTLLSFDYDPTDEDDVSDACATEDGVESCTVVTPATFNPASILDDNGIEVGVGDYAIVSDDDSISLQITKTKEKPFYKGPFVFKAGVSASLSLGVRGGLVFSRDTNASPEFDSDVTVFLGPVVKAQGAAFGKALLGVLGISLTGTLTFVELDVLPGVTVGLIQDLRNEGQAEECWWRNVGRVAFNAPMTFKSMAGDVKVAAIIEVELGDLSITKTLYEFTLFEWDAPFIRTWDIFSSVKRFGVGAGMCEGAPVPGVEWKSPLGCKTATGKDAYCPLADGRWNYRERLYVGPQSKGRLIIDGVTELGADWLRILPGPLTDHRVSFSLNESASNFEDGEVQFGDNRALVVERFFNDNGGRSLALSGSFKKRATGGSLIVDYELSEPARQEADVMRWIDVELHTDGTLSAGGVSIRHETATGEEGKFATDDVWRFARGENAPSNFQMLDFAGPQTSKAWADRGVPDEWWGRTDRPHWVPNAERADVKWIAGGPDFGILGQQPAAGWFRRTFIASSNSYVATLFCDDDCDVYVDGNLERNYNLSEGWQWFFIETLPGVPHVLTVKLNNQGGDAGFALMLKDEENLTPIGCGFLPKTKALLPNQEVTSCNSAYKLVHQGDGNVVLYDAQGGALWATNTAGQPTTKLVQQRDGNVVLYTTSGVAWSTSTFENFGAYLELQDDGGLVIRNGHEGNTVVWTR